ncbi:hypothetical protein B0H17DRAFT_1089315 [Mycena rosella]|uniref:Uncharacterized protein n=1 Tax=Mycena rosella TaxID=1033263 RepID=A0AAD7CWL8_MYCRO|nr:hypothetical protein B0H17DRAFT_1089315 [Mycena rosella]
MLATRPAIPGPVVPPPFQQRSPALLSQMEPFAATLAPPQHAPVTPAAATDLPLVETADERSRGPPLVLLAPSFLLSPPALPAILLVYRGDARPPEAKIQTHRIPPPGRPPALTCCPQTRTRPHWSSRGPLWPLSLGWRSCRILPHRSRRRLGLSHLVGPSSGPPHRAAVLARTGAFGERGARDLADGSVPAGSAAGDGGGGARERGRSLRAPRCEGEQRGGGGAPLRAPRRCQPGPSRVAMGPLNGADPGWLQKTSVAAKRDGKEQRSPRVTIALASCRCRRHRLRRLQPP